MSELLDDVIPTYVLDVGAMTDRQSAYDQLLEVLPLPQWCGRNLDALYDALWEVPECVIVIQNSQMLDGRDPMGEYGQRLMQVFLDIASQRDDIRLVAQRGADDSRLDGAMEPIADTQSPYSEEWPDDQDTGDWAD